VNAPALGKDRVPVVPKPQLDKPDSTFLKWALVATAGLALVLGVVWYKTPLPNAVSAHHLGDLFGAIEMILAVAGFSLTFYQAREATIAASRAARAAFEAVTKVRTLDELLACQETIADVERVLIIHEELAEHDETPANRRMLANAYQVIHRRLGWFSDDHGGGALHEGFHSTMALLNGSRAILISRVPGEIAKPINKKKLDAHLNNVLLALDIKRKSLLRAATELK